MANILISDLEPAGANLFRDSESFLHELTEQEVGSVLGGRQSTIDGGVEIAWTFFCVYW